MIMWMEFVPMSIAAIRRCGRSVLRRIRVAETLREDTRPVAACGTGAMISRATSGHQLFDVTDEQLLRLAKIGPVGPPYADRVSK